MPGASWHRYREVWRQIWSNNPNERLNREIRRPDVVGTSDPDSVIRLVGAVLARQHDKGAEGRRSLGLEVIARNPLVLIQGEATNTVQKEDPNEALAA